MVNIRRSRTVFANWAVISHREYPPLTRMLCQPSQVPPRRLFQRALIHRIRGGRCPLVHETLLASCGCIPKPSSARLARAHCQPIQLGGIGSAGTSISRSWTIGFAPKSSRLVWCGNRSPSQFVWRLLQRGNRCFPSRDRLLGALSGKFELRPVPEFKEDMNAGTFPKWLSDDDQEKGWSGKMALSLART